MPPQRLTAAEGKTYPQEDQMTREQFVAYFFNSTTIVAIVSPSSVDVASLKTLEDARAGRPWEEVVGGVYYMLVWWLDGPWPQC